MDTDSTNHLISSESTNAVSEKHPQKRLAAVCLLLAMLVLGTGMMALAAESNESIFFHYLTDEGELTPAAACGIMGNIWAESNFNPACVGLGAAYGLCQWTGMRTARLHSYCAEHKLDSASALGQAAYTVYELKHFYQPVYEYLKNVPNTADGAYNAGAVFCARFEIPANAGWASGYRGNIARNTYWLEYGVNALYLKPASGGRYITLKWSGKWTGKLLVMRADKFDGKYKAIAELDKKTYSYTDKTVKKKHTYYYYLCPKSGKRLLTENRSNRVGATSMLSVRDSECTIELSRTEYTYNGKEKKPEVKVWYNGKKLKKNKDYTISYQKNVDAGKAYVKVSGKGKYSGTKKIWFRIRKAEIKVKVKEKSFIFTKKSIAPGIQVKGISSSRIKCRFKVADKTVARGKGSKIRLFKAGRTEVTVLVWCGKNYRIAEKTFTLTVKPAAPVIGKTSLNRKTLTVRWKAEGKPAGYEVMYTSRSKFDKKAQVHTVEEGRKRFAKLKVSKSKKVWQVRIRSYTITEDNRKLYSKWSRTVKVRR